MSTTWVRGRDPGRRLEGKVAVVTGAGSAEGVPGVGVAVAVLFASQGARIGVLDVSPNRAESTRRWIADIGGECAVAIGDLTNEADSSRCIREVVDVFGQLDTLVNSAAIVDRSSPVKDTVVGDWNATIALNLTGAMLVTKHALPHLYGAGGGSIINISSIAGSHGLGSGAYGASKAALIGQTKDWAYQLGRKGIRVNCLVPGHIWTPMVEGIGDELRVLRRRSSLLDTEGSPWDVAWAAVFLASDEARWITGVALPIDGGTTATTALGISMLNERAPTVLPTHANPSLGNDA